MFFVVEHAVVSVSAEGTLDYISLVESFVDLPLLSSPSEPESQCIATATEPERKSLKRKRTVSRRLVEDQTEVTSLRRTKSRTSKADDICQQNSPPTVTHQSQSGESACN